ncbi:SprT-like domain-containing protein [Yeosuana sp. AK3]
MDLMEARELALELMKQHGLEYRFRFEFDNAKRRFGSCRFNPRFITLSKHLVQLNDYNVVRNVILHEIAHALVGPNNGHNWVWRQTAIEIGCDGNRCYCLENTTTVERTLIANCPNCGIEYGRFRKPRKQYSCGKCSGGTFNKNYLLEYKPKNTNSKSLQLNGVKRHKELKNNYMQIIN